MIQFSLDLLSIRKPIADYTINTFVISENEETTLYVVTCNPITLYFMNMTGKSVYFVDFFDIFPRMASRVWQPFVTVAPLGNPLKGQVILHEQQVMHPRLLTWDSYAQSNLCERKSKSDFPSIPENMHFHGDQGEVLKGGSGVKKTSWYPPLCRDFSMTLILETCKSEFLNLSTNDI